MRVTLREYMDEWNKTEPDGPWSHNELMGIFANKLGVSFHQITRWYYRSAEPANAEDKRKIKALTNSAVTVAELSKLPPRRKNPRGEAPVPPTRGTGAET